MITAVCGQMSVPTANLGGSYPSALDTIQSLARAREVVATFFNCLPCEVVFGANMTTLTGHVARSIGLTLSHGDNIVVSSLDHDANVTPWKLIGRDHGCDVRTVNFHREDCLLDLSSLSELVDANTKLVAVGAAANSCGSITDIRKVVEIVKKASDCQALVYVDAVHFAPHHCIDVVKLDCDFLVCSSYKFCGPHAGLMYGRKTVMERLTPYKLSACTNLLPSALSSQSSRWETGTASFEAIAGIKAAVEYIASLGVRAGKSGVQTDLRTRIETAYDVINEHEIKISRMFLSGAKSITGLTVHGVTSFLMEGLASRRTPTFCVSMLRMSAGELAQQLAARGVAAGAGHFYALQFPERMNLVEAGGFTRIGFFHYNTLGEVQRVLAVLTEISSMLN